MNYVKKLDGNRFNVAKAIYADANVFTHRQLELLKTLVAGKYCKEDEVRLLFKDVENVRQILAFYSQSHLIRVNSNSGKLFNFIDAQIPSEKAMQQDVERGQTIVEEMRQAAAAKKQSRQPQAEKKPQVDNQPDEGNAQSASNPMQKLNLPFKIKSLSVDTGPSIKDIVKRRRDDEEFMATTAVTKEPTPMDEYNINYLTKALSMITIFNVSKVSDVVNETSEEPPLAKLFGPFFYENECAILFADSNVGKSILAVQIGETIAKSTNDNVVYFDFELSKNQFGQRYQPTHVFPQSFMRAELSLDRYNKDNQDYYGMTLEEAIIFEIEHVIRRTNAKVAIIDNLTYICMQSESGVEAGQLMRKLLEMKKKMNVALLVVAHTPKRPLNEPLTQNSLAGSKRIANFADSIFAMGISAQSSDIRYLKQIKSRNGAIKYDADNVVVGHIEMVDGALRFVRDGFGSEYQHLRAPSERSLQGPDDETLKLVVSLYEKYHSGRKIAKELSISHVTAQKYIKIARNRNMLSES